MADYILVRKSRNLISSFLHVVMNILLGVGSILLTTISGSWTLGIILVAISKWRVFAVRPRFWWLNIKSNLVDIIVGSSFVLIAYCAGTSLMPVHVILAISYVLWLIFLKPLSSLAATEIQASIAIFLGSCSAILLTASNNSVLLTAAIFVITYFAIRHILIQSSDSDFTLVAASFALISAELAWLAHSWLIVYSFGETGIMIPQLSIILTVLAFTFNRIYQSIESRDGVLRVSEVAAPIIFCILIITVIFVGFSQPIFNV